MTAPIPDQETLKLAVEDVRRVVDKQKEERQMLITQINILLAANTAFLTILTFSKEILKVNLFTLVEIILILLNYSLLLRALVPRQFLVTPNLKNDKKESFLEKYLVMTPQNYLLQTLVNLKEVYNENEQKLDDISQSVFYTANITLAIVPIILLHLFTSYFIPELQKR
ncbi:MAG TPA: hypothetical protein VK203_03855 [Nostocaceae cyanobacterium]|nr:hypothetical protein [Nostocaceae cyanobacterium]